MANIDKIILNGTQYDLPSGGSSYTAGEGIDITNDIISADTDNQNEVIASALVELHNDKADRTQLKNYQPKGNYTTQTQVDATVAAAVANYRTEVEAVNVEKVDAAALNDLDERVTTLEQGGGGGVQSDWNETDNTDPAYIQNKPTIPVVPTNVSAFTNDSGYITNTALSNYYTKAEIDAMIGQINTLLSQI